MDAAKRVLINTTAQYIKTFISGILILVSARIILKHLGNEDFGIYSLVAGVVTMLSFITSALSATTQRYLSFFHGRNDISGVKKVFCNSVFLHSVFALGLAIVLSLICPLLFNGFLNLPAGRESAAIIVYFAVVITLSLSFLASPFRAVLIANENIVYICVVDTIDAVLKISIAFALAFIPTDKLVFYSVSLTLIQFFNLFAFFVYDYIHYKECVMPRIKYIEKDMVRNLMGFAGWSMYTIGCQVGRLQGLAIVINKMLGTVANAAYGIGIQISSYINILSDALINALRPQIVKSEGGGDRERMLLLSEMACKFSFFLVSILAIPCVLEMPRILEVWLGDYPNNAVVFSQMFMIAAFVDSLTVALGITNQATGDIKKFTIFVNTGKLLTVVFAIVLLLNNCSVIWIAFVYVLIEFLSGIIRLPLLRKQVGLSIRRFLKNVVLRLIIPATSAFLSCFIIVYFFEGSWRFFFTFSISSILYAVLFYCLSMTKEEKNRMLLIIKRQ